MPFEHGVITCRILRVPRALPADAVERFAALAAAPLDSTTHTEIRGWVTGRHLLDRDINEATAYYGGFLRLTLLSAERKVPATLLRAECRMEELAHLAAHGTDYVTRQQRAEIRRSVEERLLPSMPPQLKGIPFVHVEGSGSLFAGATSVKMLDLFTAFVHQTLGMHVDPCLPGAVAMDRRSVDVEGWRPSSFSPEIEDAQAAATAGREFLTWLWFVGEARGGMVPIGDLGEAAVRVEGPLTFVLEGHGAHETVLRRGEPLVSPEAKTCLLAGKTLRSAKLTVALGDETYVTTVDADEFLFRGLRLPDTDALDPVSTFQERMARLDTFREAFFRLYDRFVDERRAPGTWRETRADIHRWVAGRRTRP